MRIVIYLQKYNVIFMVCNIINSKYEKGVDITGRHIAQNTLCRFEEIEYIWMKNQGIFSEGSRYVAYM